MTPKPLISLFKVHMPESVREPLLATLFSGFIGQGPRVDEFEAVLAQYIGNPNVLTVNSGTSGLQLALRLANVGPGDEVISTAMTCTATNMPILAMGATIVWADVDPVTGNISPAEIEAKITARTKAIVMVHWGGYPCDIAEINTLARAKGRDIKVIEDAAHGFGAEYQGRKLGNHSDFTMFSFQAIKHITTIDGGAVVCRSREDHARGKLLRWYGIDRETRRKEFRCEEDIHEWGYKFHMNDVCAAIGLAQMPHIDGILEKHRANSAFFDRELAGLPGVRTMPWKTDRRSAFWLYTLHVDRREAFSAFLQEQGVMTSQVHARNDKHTTFRRFAAELPGVTRFTDTMVCIPNGWWVTPAERDHIVDCVRSFARGR